MMSTIFLDDALIEPIVSTWLTTVPPLTATSDADTASWFAWRALSAFCFTVEVSSTPSRQPSLPASWPALRCAKTGPGCQASGWTRWRWCPCPCELRLIFEYSSCLQGLEQRPVSSVVSDSMRLVRSPAATDCATFTASSSGRATNVRSTVPAPGRARPRRPAGPRPTGVPAEYTASAVAPARTAPVTFAGGLVERGVHVAAELRRLAAAQRGRLLGVLRARSR
ncbi:hypothetical protein VVAX_06107 [Variovorax paradoxus]|uniref:Uncharacterized protein n=1 Tax=Variovorax paradoxus TaxID=34073 RepID=A0A679JAH4_VARPD|nr:hypothetical protein VVAX_06107 [Variovorax paradoxus]